MSTELEIPKQNEITPADLDCFNSYLAEGVEAWYKAGKLLVDMVERNPNAYSIIARNNPHLTIDLLLALEKIGRKEIFPYVLLDKSAGSSKLLELPYDLQVKYYKEPVEVVLFRGAGSYAVERKLATNLSKDEVKLVFGPAGVRSVEDQRKLIDGNNGPSLLNGKRTYSKRQKLAGYLEVSCDKAGKLSYKAIDYFPVSQTVKVLLPGESVVLSIYKPI